MHVSIKLDSKPGTAADIEGTVGEEVRKQASDVHPRDGHGGCDSNATACKTVSVSCASTLRGERTSSEIGRLL